MLSGGNSDITCCRRRGPANSARGADVSDDPRTGTDRVPLREEAAEGETYLFAWNPEKTEWPELARQIQHVQETGAAEDTWSCGSVKHIPPGSRFFLIRLRREPRGIIGSGYTASEVHERAHWQEERAAQGDQARFVNVRFDALSRTPIIGRPDLDAPEFQGVNWDTQMSGIRIPRDVAEAVEREWRRRLTSRSQADVSTMAPAVVDRWRDRWNEARADTAWTDRHRIRDSKREAILPEIEALISSFVSGRLTLGDFKEIFDRKTRNEWDLFGLKGLSGAMFLNKVSKNLPDQEASARVLRAAVTVPADDTEARERLSTLMAYLDRQIAEGVATGAGLQPNRSPFFVSACWHMQEPARWPIMFQSARMALQADGLLGTNLKGADGYLEFARVFRALSKALDIGFWDLEHVCARATIDAPVTEDSPDPPDEEPLRERVWLIAPGPGASLFDEFYGDGIVAIGWDQLGDLSAYSDLEAIRQALQVHRGEGASPIHDALACYQFAHEMQIGDVVFAKRGRREIVGYGVVSSAYRYAPERGSYIHVREVAWKKRGQWVPRDRPLVTKTLTDIGQYSQLVASIRTALGLEGDRDGGPAAADRQASAVKPPYSLDDAVDEMFMGRPDIEEALELLRYKKNVVLQGPPGVGKTFFAKRLAYLLLGEKDPDRVSLVQFHQSYSYEDFVQGYRPAESGKFARADGPFLRFCDRALQDTSLPYVLIIDEINRGNLSKIFGELLMLIEADKRSEAWATALIYGKEGEPPFSVPQNLHIIGTMNTADRSLAVVDYALRRRFAFIDLEPGFSQPAFVRKLVNLGADAGLRDRIIKRIGGLNDRLRVDANLGEGFCIGHSYFCQVGDGAADEGWYRRIVKNEIEPLIREYWYDQRDRVGEELARLLDDD
jgi:MoxR-like ATPase